MSKQILKFAALPANFTTSRHCFFYSENLNRATQNPRLGRRLDITGLVEPHILRLWLLSADVARQ